MNNKLLLSIVSAVAFFSGSLSASSAPSGSFDPVIEFYNKENTSVQLDINEGGRAYGTVYVPANQQWSSGSKIVDMNSPLTITISKQGKMVGRYSINAPGKTKYLSWNPSKSPALYPQTGSFMGLSGKSDSGYSLKNNLSASQITQK